MSIINQMLRDLQLRQAPIKQLPLQPLLAKNKNYFIFISLFFFIVASGLSYFWFAQSSLQEEPKIIANTQTSEISVNPSLQLLTGINDHIPVSRTINNPIIKDLQSSVLNITTIAKLNDQTINPVQTSQPLKQNITVAPDKSKTETIAETKVKALSNETLLNNQLEEIKNSFPFVGFQTTQKSLIKLLSRQPDFHSARLYLILLSWQENAIDTEQLINSSINLFPNQSAFRLAAARYFLEKQDFQQAETSLLNIQPSTNNLSELLQMRAVIRQKSNKHHLAVADYAAILRLSPDRGEIYIALGISLEALQENTQALQSFKKAELDPNLSKRQLQFVRDKIHLYSQQYQG